MHKKTKKFISLVLSISLISILSAVVSFAEGATDYEVSVVSGGVKIESVQTAESTLTIPSKIDGKNVIAIGGKVFSGMQITEVTIPSTIKSLYGFVKNDNYYSAFYGADKLQTVTFEDGITSIPEHALDGCSSVEKVVVPNSVISIAKNAFTDCTSLTDISFSNVKTIGDFAFDNCSSLENITLPDTLNEIGDACFRNCSGIINITLPEKLKTISGKTFEGTSIIGITIPASITSLYAHVENDNYYSAFYGADKLQTVIFEDDVTSIPEHAFDNCSTVERVFVPNSVTSIENNAFSNCISLKDISFNNVKTIGDFAFDNCSSLEDITLPETLTEIGDACFRDCIGIKSISLPKLISKISGKTFEGTSITEITVPASITSLYEHIENDNYYSAFYGADKLQTVTFEDGMETLPKDALKDCTQIKKVCITDYCKNIASIDEMSGTKDIKVEIIPTSISADKNLGDLNGDGNITASDARITLRIAAGLDNATSLQKISADIDKDGKVTGADARKILRIAANIDSL